MTYLTQPDQLPVPDDGSQPALALPALRALADAVQSALAGLRARADDMSTWRATTFVDWGNALIHRVWVLETQFASRYAATGGQLLADGANNPISIDTGLTTVLGGSAYNGNPAVEQGVITAVGVEHGRLLVYHTFTAGTRQINWTAVGIP
jgi:hypothetical protein